MPRLRLAEIIISVARRATVCRSKSQIYRFSARRKSARSSNGRFEASDTARTSSSLVSGLISVRAIGRPVQFTVRLQTSKISNGNWCRNQPRDYADIPTRIRVGSARLYKHAISFNAFLSARGACAVCTFAHFPLIFPTPPPLSPLISLQEDFRTVGAARSFRWKLDKSRAWRGEKYFRRIPLPIDRGGRCAPCD